MSKQNLLLILFFFLPFSALIAQSSPEQLVNVVPPSPTVASLGKYGEVPVSLYTGVPDISIPIYEIKDGSLHLPISLSYHAGGVRVEEVAPAVGLGWALNAGGVLGRNVRGMPDEIGHWLDQPSGNTVENIMLQGDTKQTEQLITEVNRGFRDGEADLYYYNFNQFSGKFFFDQAGIVHTLPSKNLLIVPVEGGWKITVEDGTVYTFNKVEQVSSSSCAPDQTVYSAWFLASIKSPDGKREITFSYDRVNYTYETIIAQTKYFSVNSSGSTCLQNPAPCLGTQNYNTYRISRINFSEGYVQFNYNTVRCDLMMDKSLDEIAVYSRDNALIKKFSLTYSYFGDNSNGCTISTQNLKRLKLVSVTEAGTGTQKPPYLFSYNESIALPGRLSYSQDHWGYYNGKPNNDLIATFTTMIIPGIQVTFPGADRKANPETAQAGILTKIRYPTGGETLFTYESNTVTDSAVESQTTDQGIFLMVNQLTSTLPAPFESDALVIPPQGALVRVNVSGLSNSLWLGCDIVHCYIMKDNNPTPFWEIDNGWNGLTSSWPAGTYKIKLVNECGVASVANFNVSISAQISTSQTNAIKPVGGLRIKQIEDRPGDGGQPMVKSYRYHPENDPAHSSGVLVNFPDYGYDLGVQSIKLDDRGNPDPINFCSYRVRQSFSNYPMATTQGSYVGYRNVVVDLGENGESRYSFNAYSDLSAHVFPFAPNEDFDWTRGFLLKSQDFVRKNGALVLVKETINTPTSLNQHRMYGIKTGSNFYNIYGGEMVPVRQSLPAYSFYPTITEFYALGQTRERMYDQDDSANFVETVTDYTYSPEHLQLTQSKAVTSKSVQTTVEEIVSNKKYPFDYNFSSTPIGAEAMGIKKLQDLHAVNAVIEEYVVKQNRDVTSNQVFNQRVIDGGITIYKSDKPYPDQLLKLEIGSPLPITDFKNGSLLNANSFIKNANAGINASYKPAIIFNSYDDQGNITTQQKADDVKKSYIWGYNYTYPVAEVVGVDCATILANSNLNQAILQSSSTTDEDMRAELNKIRIAFPAALVTTYTYNPLVGIKSQTDVNNRSVYYEYDSIGRLSFIRDQDKNILKKFCYNYVGQQESCAINTDTH